MAKTKTRTALVTVRLLPGERIIIDRAATKLNKTISEFMRSVALERVAAGGAKA